MDCGAEELYFQKLQELVQDEDKIVTVASFASNLNISVQKSQELVKKYVDDQRKLNANDLAVTYILTGCLKENRGKAVLMVKEDDLEAKQSLFESTPFKLIYSVQKTKDVDFNIIALVDMFDSTKIREKALEGSIVSKNCIKRILKVKKDAPGTSLKKGSSLQIKPNKLSEDTTSSDQHSETSRTQQKPKPSGNIANIFKAAVAKTNQINSEKKLDSNLTPKNFSKQGSKFGKKNSGLTGFLSSGVLKSPKSNSQVQETAECDKSSNNSQEDIKDDEIMEVSESVCKDIVSDKIKDETIKKSKDGTKKHNKKRQRDKSQDIPSKRRKRIVERNDSDSDDLFEKEEENDVVEKSEEESERIPSPVEQIQPIKSKSKKAVHKTYKDEDDFVVTKKEHIFVTSEEENKVPNPPQKLEVQEKPKSKANDKKKPAKNQSTLMNFFKKV